ncbi:hypothetical protein DWX43_23340 [Clostridium sp. AF19-22AC]|nr:hypothetical protein DWX43_23340 [Clostridium sp. AF19-22AC]
MLLGILCQSLCQANRTIYLCGIKQKISSFAFHLRKTDAAVSLVTVGSRQYYVYHYEGAIIFTDVQTIPLRETIIMFYITNETLSIIENAAYFIPISKKLKNLLLHI